MRKAARKLVSVLLALVMLASFCGMASPDPVALESAPEELFVDAAGVVTDSAPEDVPADEDSDDAAIETANEDSDDAAIVTADEDSNDAWEPLMLDGDPAQIPSAGLALTLPAAGGSYSGGVPAAVSISSGTGFTVKSANWFNGGTPETNPGCGLAPASFEAGKPYFAEILLAPAEGYAFTDSTSVTIDTLGVKTKEVVDYEADNMGCLRIVTDDYTIPAATYTITVNGGKAYNGPGAIHSEITSAEAGDEVYVRFDGSVSVPDGKYRAGFTSEQAGQGRYLDLTGEDVVLHFTMPAENVVIDPLFEDQMTLTVDLTSGSATFPYGVFMLLDSSFYAARTEGKVSINGEYVAALDRMVTVIDADKDENFDIINDIENGFSLHDDCSLSGDYVISGIGSGAPYTGITLKFPAVPTTYPVWVGGTQVTSANKDNILGDGTASFDPSSNTLTLNGLNVGDGLHASGASIVSAGIDLTVKGSATLSGAGYGIYVFADGEGGGNLTLDGATITYAVASGSDTGICADGDIIISESDINVSAAKNGISAGGDLTISGSEVTATGSEDGVGNGAGISADDVSISDSTVTAKGRVYGIFADGDLSVSGDKLSAETWVKNESRAISAGGDITISKGIVETKTAASGICSLGKIKIENGTEKLESDAKKYAVWAETALEIGDGLMIKEPKDGINDGTGICESDGVTEAAYALIVPKEALPRVIGVEANVTGTQENAGGYDVTTDALETLFESSTAPVTMSTSFLYTDQACQIEDKLTTAPVAGTPYYFIISIDAYTDGDPATLEWADNATIKSGSTLTADNGTVEIVELAHSPGGGCLSVICKYTETAAGKFPVVVVVTTWDKNGSLISAVGGTATADKTEVAKGETINVTVTPNEGYALESIGFGDGATIGYQVGKETSSTVPDDFTSATGDLQIDVIFKETPPVVTHTVTFESNGGSAVAAQTVNDGEKATKPADPTKSGVSFGGWYKDELLTEPFDFDTPITGDITLYASWNQYIYMLQIVKVWEDDDDAAGKRPDSVDVKILANGTETDIVTLTKDGEWKRLYLLATGEADLVLTCEEIVPEGYTLKDVSRTGDTVTLTNQYTGSSPAPTTYTVAFETNGGSAVAAQTVNDGEKATKPADPTKSGFVFDGWYADATFSAAFDFDTAITADVTVYAKWTEETAPGEISYTVVSGGSSTWTKGSGSDVTIVVKRNVDDDTCFSHFTGVQIDGTTLVSGTDYTAAAGSTVITLKASALEKLSTGTKAVTINFDDGKAATDLTIKAASAGTGSGTGTGTRTGTTPRTGDNSSTGLWTAMLILSVMGLCGASWIGKKRRCANKH